MYQILKKHWSKSKHLTLYVLCVATVLLVAVVYKSEEKITKKSDLIKTVDASSEFKTFKKFLLDQIKSPFINLNYEIKSGDTLLKIVDASGKEVKELVNKNNCTKENLLKV